ncbi:MAG TPA: N-acetylglucosamine-6-phosphate deacetylase [Pyrinomonadaceae bacterium]|nr:N-acetylglucosamine-6-phosphate deacetylase [Pyrinomonadaceae bacterium]
MSKADPPRDDSRTTSVLLRGARIISPHKIIESGSLLVKDGRILCVRESLANDGATAERTIDLSGLTLYPGFVDVHIHGAVGVDTMEATTDDLSRVAQFLAREGVTAWLPTLVPAPVEDYRRAANSIEQLIARQDDVETPAAARALGLHYEGPFINSAQCGALRPPYFRTYAKPEDLSDLPVANARGAIRMITVAPEIEGGIELVGELVRRGWIVSIGHTRAGVESLEEACAAGARHMTHFFNAMSPLNHRAPGPVGWGLMRDDVTCDIIADGHHVAPLMLQLALRCKTTERLMLISDAVAPAGEGDGEFRIWGETIKVSDGRTRNERGSIAGSVITLRDAVQQMRALGAQPHEVSRMASANPARLIGVADSCGTIEEGKRADLTALDEEGRVRLTLIGGRVAFNELQAGGG